MDSAIYVEIENLRKQSTRVLRAQYRELFGQDSPSGNRTHLYRRIAWRLQAQVAGGLSDRARKRAAELASEHDLRLRAPKQFWKDVLQQQTASEERRREDRDPRLPEPGTILRRMYEGREVAITVLEDSFEFESCRYRSLSAAVQRATGTRWNGFAFFRLTESTRG